jgi:hypothetical protein
MRAFGSLLALLAVVAVGLYIYRSQLAGPGDVSQGTGNVRAAADITGVKNDLLAMAQAERAHMALNGSYTSLEELHSSGELSVDPQRDRQGYTYSAQIDDRTFTITASYSGPADMPDFSIDESMQVTQR